MKEYFEIRIQDLQRLGEWAADCAGRSVAIYENVHPQDHRVRDAIAGIRAFAASGKRTHALRKLALDAYRASLETNDQVASAAAMAASLAAASAYTHPFKDIRQAQHILGAAAYSALAIELLADGDTAVGEREIAWAVTHIHPDVIALLEKMPAQISREKRIDQLFCTLDRRLRGKSE